MFFLSIICVKIYIFVRVCQWFSMIWSLIKMESFLQACLSLISFFSIIYLGVCWVYVLIYMLISKNIVRY